MDETLMYQVDNLNGCVGTEVLADNQTSSQFEQTVCDLKSIFDGCPSSYTKQDYQALIENMGAGIINALSEIETIQTTGGDAVETPGFYGFATKTTNPENDRKSAKRTLKGIYIAQEPGTYTSFGKVNVDLEELLHNYVILSPDYAGTTFKEYKKVKVPYPSVTAQTFTDNFTVSLQNGKTFGKYVNGDLVPCKDMSATELLKDMATESTINFTVSPEILEYADSDYKQTVIVTFLEPYPKGSHVQLIDTDGNATTFEIVDNKFSFDAYVDNPGEQAQFLLKVDGITSKLMIDTKSKPSIIPNLFIVAKNETLSKISSTESAAEVPEVTIQWNSGSSQYIDNTKCKIKKVSLSRVISGNSTTLKVYDDVSSISVGKDSVTDSSLAKQKDISSVTYELKITDSYNNVFVVNSNEITWFDPVIYFDNTDYSTDIIYSDHIQSSGSSIILNPSVTQYSWILSPNKVDTFIMNNELDVTNVWFLQENTVTINGVVYNIYRSSVPGAYANNVITLK